MKILVTILTTAMVFVGSLLTSGKQEITVTVVNATTDNGKVSFALYDQVTFMKTPLKGASAKIIKGKSIVTFKNIAQGEYSVICFHDKNNNGKMDFNENGMPLEDYGASNNNMDFGPPSFLDSKFTVIKEDVSLEIKF
ncbi:MAG: DUF2141 domain-containing protein [Flavobacteriaceae bacterium]|jgi:uncharacterized protein (DUF2141 family)|tara:strand:+ start:1313 stop:1726 length:414 start_codon:yes stop_codon:yes gene_type:complete